MRRAVGNYELDDDPARIDPAAAAAFLTTEAYWGRWRAEQDIRRQIATAWRVIGAYDAAGAMVGLARAISDARLALANRDTARARSIIGQVLNQGG